MQPQLRDLAHDSLHQIRDTMRRMQELHPAPLAGRQVPARSVAVTQPEPDVAAWEDTEIDIRRVVL
ncbi:MAG: hypothetical protein EKK52_15290 [Burkholderiales bacterium]|uniref:hypothetical protein n=1 Tax=Roseateles sp. TaxID=1971397 RepID=UPI000F93B2BE|nr:MAG: hypothetical protein EKK52_15290 [Burkholderiales bacterium]